MRDQRVAEFLLHLRGPGRKTRDALDRLDREMIAVELVEDDHVEWRGRGAFLGEAAHIHAGMIWCGCG